MEDKIRMIPIENLKHHPLNPRTDIGDVTELADSIRSQGILQNLTVVPDGESDKFLVLIGNRRYEAAKIAGLTELPCTVAHMDEREQLQTMIAENMQRQDLTVYDQAVGFQMMLDLGCSEDEIAARTGVSRTTVGRRLKMAELDRDTLYSVVKGQQMTIMDFERLGQIRSVKERNAILKKAQKEDIKWELARALELQRATDAKPMALRFLRGAGIQQIDRNDQYSGKWDSCYNLRVRLSEWDGTVEKLIPKEKADAYYVDDTTVNYFTKAKKTPKSKPEKPQKSQEEIDEERKVAEAWKKLEEDCGTAKQLRAAFARGIRVTERNRDRLVKELVSAVVLDISLYETPRTHINQHFLHLGESYPKFEAVEAALKDSITGKELPELALAFWEGDKVSMPIKNAYKSYLPEFQPSWRLQHLYEWLCAEGYHLSKVEQQLIAGTHPSFKSREAVNGDG